MVIERENMLNEEYLNDLDDQLAQERLRARKLVVKYNQQMLGSAEADATLKELLGSVGEDALVEVSFRYDYGCNIHLSDSVVMHCNFILLDVCEICVGTRTSFGPNVQIHTASHPLNVEVRARGLLCGKSITIGEDM